MTRRALDLSKSFGKDSFLQQFYLDRVIPTGRTLGAGSYGSVFEMEYQHATCAAKQMHELLLDPGNEGVHETIEKYQRECQLMASLRHPNITQFLGLCFLETSPLPLLVMERLEMSVDDLLECAPNIPLPVKLSILTDTCSGLAYLHGRKTPVVHRDLTAKNVLLTSSFTAKIADLGNSRIVSLTPSQLAQTLSKNPGTTVYMAPEALSDSHRYGPSLDVFSFGHLCLYTLTQVFPSNLLAATQVDPVSTGRVIGRTEVERRDVYMKKLEGQFSESHPILVQLVSQCLDNDPLTRPSSEETLGRLQDKKKEIERIHGGNLEKILNIASILVEKEIKTKDKKIMDLQNSEARHETEVEELQVAKTRLEADKTRAFEDLTREKQELELKNNQLEAKNKSLQQDITLLQSEKHEFKSRLEDLQSEKHEFESRLEDLQSEKHEFESHLEDLQSEKHEFESRLEDLQSEKHELERRLEDQQRLVTEKQTLEELVEQLKKDQEAFKTQEKEAQLQTALPPISSKILPPSLEWRKGPDMPLGMGGHIQAVELEGTVYVGGGYTGLYDDDCIVMAYDTRSSKWHSLPPHSAINFSMTAVDNKLVLGGGYFGGAMYSREVRVWHPRDRKWTEPFPAMPKGRSRSSSTCYKHWLVIAGGYTSGKPVDTVMILNIDTKQWSNGPSTPVSWYDMKSAVIKGTWYLMGGWSGEDCDAYSVSLEALVKKPPSRSFSIWQKLTPLMSKRSCPLNMRGSLLAVGGRSKDNEQTSSIMRYAPETINWVPAGELPRTLYNCTCITVAEKMYVFGGDIGSKYLKTMHYLQII